MALPPIVVPQFPTVPLAAGVPALQRSAQATLATLGGALNGIVSDVTGEFTGAFSGLLTQPDGFSSFVQTSMRGIIDQANNLTANLLGSLNGRVIGALGGTKTGGVISGRLTGVINGLAAATKGALDPVSSPEASPPFKWGVFDDEGNAVLTGDTVTAFDYAKDYRVPTFPIEGGTSGAAGSFESYNKVEVPTDIRLTILQGGSEFERSGFLAALDTLVASVNVYTVATPEKQYTNMNLVHYDMRRTTQNGVTLLTVDVHLQQIRNSTTVTFSNTRQPDGSAAVNDGPVQPGPLTSAAALAIAGGF